jgi:hypothetical protein
LRTERISDGSVAAAELVHGETARPGAPQSLLGLPPAEAVAQAPPAKRTHSVVPLLAGSTSEQS